MVRVKWRLKWTQKWPINRIFIGQAKLTFSEFQFHRRLLNREDPMVPKICLPICDVRDTAKAHISALTASSAPGQLEKKSIKSGVLRA